MNLFGIRLTLNVNTKIIQLKNFNLLPNYFKFTRHIGRPSEYHQQSLEQQPTRKAAMWPTFQDRLRPGMMPYGMWVCHCCPNLVMMAYKEPKVEIMHYTLLWCEALLFVA